MIEFFGDVFYYQSFDGNSNGIANGMIRLPGIGALPTNPYGTGFLLKNADTYEEMYHKWFMQ